MTETANAQPAPPSSRERLANAASPRRFLARHPGAIPAIREAVHCLARHPEALTTVDALFREDPTVGTSGPWWNRHAIRYFDAQLKPGDRVFEWGSGGSTAWLLSKGAQVISVEDDMEWVGKVRARCPEAEIRAIPGTETGKIREWYFQGVPGERNRRYFDDYIAAIDEFPDESFDVVIVDGMCRVDCFHRALPKVRPGGLVVVDDSDMPPFRSLRMSVPGWTTRSFAGFKATKDLRETTFFRRPR